MANLLQLDSTTILKSMGGRERHTCKNCGKRRMCGWCVACEDGWYCSDCSRKTKDGADTWVCDGCYEEALDYKRYGPWGPDY